MCGAPAPPGPDGPVTARGASSVCGSAAGLRAGCAPGAAAACGDGSGRTRSLRPTGTLRAVGKRDEWEVCSHLLLCAPWVPRASNRLKGRDEVSHGGRPHPRHQPCSWAQPRSKTVDRFPIFSVPKCFWSIVPKKAHWVLDAPGLGAQFFIRYIH